MSSTPSLSPLACEWPEVETGLPTIEKRRQRYAIPNVKTSIDVLELTGESTGPPTWTAGLGHDALIDHFQSDCRYANGDGAQPALQMLFVNADVDPPNDLQVILVEPRSLDWLHGRFGFSQLFSDCLLDISKGAKTGDSQNTVLDSRGNVHMINGFYRMGNNHGAAHIWFSYDVVTMQARYIVANCPPRAKARILACARCQKSSTLLRPFVIDCFIADERTWDFKNDIVLARKRLATHEQYDPSGAPTELQQSFNSLHRLSQIWFILNEDILDFEGRIQFLMTCSSRLYRARRVQKRPIQDQISESLRFLLSRTQIWRRWVGNYNTRTRDRVDLYFNLATQTDNKTNLEIASVSKKISEETRKDSLSMITLAAVTVVFLPGTFVTGLFSMVFFTTSTSTDGNTQVTSTNQLWWFFAVAIPLTLVVFIIWYLWRHRRGIKKGIIVRNLGNGNDLGGILPFYHQRRQPSPAELPEVFKPTMPPDAGRYSPHEDEDALMLRETQLVSRRV